MLEGMEKFDTGERISKACESKWENKWWLPLPKLDENKVSKSLMQARGKTNMFILTHK